MYRSENMERRIENFQHYEGKVCKTEKQNVPYDTGTNTDKKENVGFWETNSRSLKECHFKGKKRRKEHVTTYKSCETPPRGGKVLIKLTGNLADSGSSGK